MKSRKNVAILLHGLLHRSLEHTIDSFQNHIIWPLEIDYHVDVYYHSWIVDVVYNPRGEEKYILVDSSVIGRLLPYAKWFVENQNEYDQEVNLRLEDFSVLNPMCLNTNDPTTIYITALNCMRDLESIKRAFDYMDTNKNVEYDFVIVCRPDVEFLNDLNLNKIKNRIMPDTIFVPFVDSFWGVNDRFAIGDYETIRIYCDRTKEVKAWILSDIKENTESYLKRYLISKWILIREHLFLFFRRIRATWKISIEDVIYVFGRPRSGVRSYMLKKIILELRNRLGIICKLNIIKKKIMGIRKIFL